MVKYFNIGLFLLGFLILQASNARERIFEGKPPKDNNDSEQRTLVS
jgi:hypothetical protein